MPTQQQLTTLSGNYQNLTIATPGGSEPSAAAVRINLTVPPTLLQASQGVNALTKLYCLGYRMDCWSAFTVMEGFAIGYGITVEIHGIASVVIANEPQGVTEPQTNLRFISVGQSHVEQMATNTNATGDKTWFSNVQEPWTDAYTFPRPLLISSPSDFSMTCGDWSAFRTPAAELTGFIGEYLTCYLLLETETS